MIPIKRKAKIILANLFEEMFMRESKNISHWRQRNALEETGRYIEQHLPRVSSFPSRYALFNLIAKEIEGKKGLICEFGVAGGKSINYLAGKMQDHILYGFDSFEGLPENWRDGMPQGAYRQAKLPRVASNVRLIKGLFDVSLPNFLDEQKDNALFLHIDCDLYSSTRTVFELIGQRIEKGTILCFDEYFNYPSWQDGEHKAFMEFVSRRNIKFEYLGFCSAGTQLVLRIC